MSDELNAEVTTTSEAETEAVETPTETSSPEVEAVETAESQTEASSESSEEQGKPEKPTRAERRVQQLLDKLKDKPQVQDLPPPQTVDENEIDPTAIKFVDERVQRGNQQTIQQIKSELAYERSIEDHADDIVKASDGLDPKIERIAVKQYQAMNYQINPFTGQEIFIPTVKFSEVVKSIQADLEDITASKVADAQTSMARQAQESAVQPSGNTTEKFDLRNARKQIWSNPSQVAKELESRLGFSED